MSGLTSLFYQAAAAIQAASTQAANATNSAQDKLTRLVSTGVSNGTSNSLALVLAGIAAWMVFSNIWNRHAPPGPPGLPLLGNLFQMPTQMPWLQFTKWSNEYGPIFSLDLLGQRIVVLNTHKAVGDLFDRRSNIYSDRPRYVMAGDILTGGVFMVFSGYGDVWRKMRRAAHESFNARSVEKYQSIQAEATVRTVSRIIAQPESWEGNVKLLAASSILSSIYGWPIMTFETPIIKRLHAHTARIASAVVPGTFLVDLIPIMKYLPTWMARWKREGLEWHEQETAMFEEFNAGVAQKMNEGVAQQSFVTELIETDHRHGLSKKEAAWLASIMVSAGAETTSTTILNFILAMTLNPSVMYKAQAEIDVVVGRDRVPTFEDKANLPYIRAMVRETLRWRPVGPLAVPRRTTEDDWYEGYFIPKGTIVIGNVWAMNRNPVMFPDFDEFRPDRFLDETGKVEIAPPDTHQMGHVSYGFGRRTCVGLHYANQALFMAITTLLWAADIKPAVDGEGKDILPSTTEWIDAGVVVGPAPFKCRVSPRSPEVQAILEATVVAL